MDAIEKLRTALKLTEAEMQEWLGVFLAGEARILPEQDRTQRLAEIRNDADRYFTAEMDRRFRDEQPLTYEELKSLIDHLFNEIGVNDVPPRKTPLNKPPWQTTN